MLQPFLPERFTESQVLPPTQPEYPEKIIHFGRDCTFQQFSRWTDYRCPTTSRTTFGWVIGHTVYTDTCKFVHRGIENQVISDFWHPQPEFFSCFRDFSIEGNFLGRQEICTSSGFARSIPNSSIFNFQFSIFFFFLGDFVGFLIYKGVLSLYPFKLLILYIANRYNFFKICSLIYNLQTGRKVAKRQKIMWISKLRMVVFIQVLSLFIFFCFFINIDQFIGEKVCQIKFDLVKIV